MPDKVTSVPSHTVAVDVVFVALAGAALTLKLASAVLPLQEPFAATVSKSLMDVYSDLIVPCIYAMSEDGTSEGFDNAPRIFYNNGKKVKTTHFGASGMSDYTKHKDRTRKKRYMTRHKKRENWDDYMSAGSLSRWILWNKQVFRRSFIDYKKRFK